MCLLWIQSFITKRMAYVSRLAVAKERLLLTLVECGGAVYVSWDEGGLWLLPHSVVPHPPDAALGWEKRQPLIRTQHGATFIEGFFAPKGWVAMRVCASNLHLYTKKKKYPAHSPLDDMFVFGYNKALHVLLIQPKMDTLRVLRFVIWEIGPEQHFFFFFLQMLRAGASAKFPEVLLR